MPPENLQPPPTRLSITPFDAFNQQIKDAEFGNYILQTFVAKLKIFSTCFLNE
ncbi:hypothetical protein RDI58_011213 [Solanum bulbocastanum]|uniref:Uncharacterized protein n=1 Tax=Solanum bulbocastanum TaxID=147425 RepID=A0AAN8YH34_SOLBU